MSPIKALHTMKPNANSIKLSFSQQPRQQPNTTTTNNNNSNNTSSGVSIDSSEERPTASQQPCPSTRTDIRCELRVDDQLFVGISQNKKQAKLIAFKKAVRKFDVNKEIVFF